MIEQADFLPLLNVVLSSDISIDRVKEKYILKGFVIVPVKAGFCGPLMLFSEIEILWVFSPS